MTDNRSTGDNDPFWLPDEQRAPRAPGVPGAPGGVHETVAYGPPAGGAAGAAGTSDTASFGAPDLDGRAPAGAARAGRPAAPRLTKGGAVGLVAASVLAGALGVAALTSTSTSSNAAATTPAAPQSGVTGGGTTAGGETGNGGPDNSVPGRLGMADPDRLGRVSQDGEQHVVGTLTAVSSTSITVKSAAGMSSTYTVKPQTPVWKNGAQSSVSALASGDRVLVHVLTGGSTPVVERIMAGQVPMFGGRHLDRDGGPGDGRFHGWMPPGGMGPGGDTPPGRTSGTDTSTT